MRNYNRCNTSKLLELAEMISISDATIDKVKIDGTWNFGDRTEWAMHSIHAYPAKFPAFIASKAFEYAENEGVNVEKVADIFCGCGTVALEAKLHRKDFWGCDINPVAALIAKVKSTGYKIHVLEKYYSLVCEKKVTYIERKAVYEKANERLRYWFDKDSYLDLYAIKCAIDDEIPKGKYRDFFVCIFSSMLKAASRWLTKSIKPQVDPYKNKIDVNRAFSLQYQKFLNAVKEMENIHGSSEIRIQCANFLTIKKLPKVDLILTSPPYVTSYEYADLHQLSSLWLGFAEDYRMLRKGSIGSVHNNKTFSDMTRLNVVAQRILSKLEQTNIPASKFHAVARYYFDLQCAVQKCHGMLRHGGMAFFVIGNTEYKGVPIQNSFHLIQTLQEYGFSDIKIGKRKISKKILTPYRDKFGRFSSSAAKRKIYHEEWIISGRV